MIIYDETKICYLIIVAINSVVSGEVQFMKESVSGQPWLSFFVWASNFCFAFKIVSTRKPRNKSISTVCNFYTRQLLPFSSHSRPLVQCSAL